MEYRHIEPALMRLFDITDTRTGGFRAKIRHLRGLGIPSVKKPGSGAKVEYTRENAVELALALELERLGKAPRMAARLARSYAVEAVLNDETVPARYLVMLPARIDADEDIEISLIANGFEGLTAFLKDCPSFAIVNLSALARELDKYLK